MLVNCVDMQFFTLLFFQVGLSFLQTTKFWRVTGYTFEDKLKNFATLRVIFFIKRSCGLYLPKRPLLPSEFFNLSWICSGVSFSVTVS